MRSQAPADLRRKRLQRRTAAYAPGSCRGRHVICLESCELSLGQVSSVFLEHRMGFEPMNTGFADQRVSHFAIGAHTRPDGKLSLRIEPV